MENTPTNKACCKECFQRVTESVTDIENSRRGVSLTHNICKDPSCLCHYSPLKETEGWEKEHYAILDEKLREYDRGTGTFKEIYEADQNYISKLLKADRQKGRDEERHEVLKLIAGATSIPAETRKEILDLIILARTLRRG